MTCGQSLPLNRIGTTLCAAQCYPGEGILNSLVTKGDGAVSFKEKRPSDAISQVL